jgi:SAM-dependent methyltransferase
MPERHAYSLPEELRPMGIELEFVPCAACGCNEFETVLAGHDRLHQRPGRFRVVRCARCQLLRTNPRPTVGSIGQYYPAEYEPYLETASERPVWRQALSRLVDPVDTSIPTLAPGDLLEIGAAAGNFLVRMQRLGWRVTGVEFDPMVAAMSAARTKAFVHVGDLMSAAFSPESFDLVCGWMVFEHLHDPVLAMTRCLEWLRPGGWLCFSVPDAGSWQFRAFGDAWFALQLPTHLYHFDKVTLAALLKRCGYANVSLRWQRTWFDVAMSFAYKLEDVCGFSPGSVQRLARCTASRGLARALGAVAGPLRLTGRLTIWAQRPEVSSTSCL